MSNKKRVAVIFGGQSSEHEVSCASAESILTNIDQEKFDIASIGITKEGKWLKYDGPVGLIGNGGWAEVAERHAIAAATGQNAIVRHGNSALDILGNPGSERGDGAPDIVFPILHGTNGEDGTLQGLLELASIPYVGSGVLGSALGMDKAYAKMLFERAGLPQGRYIVIDRKQLMKDKGMEQSLDKIEDELGYPCFIKPSNAGSSVGVSKAHGRAELRSALLNSARYDKRILAEEFIDGREIECAVLGNDEPIASTVGEVIPCNEFYDYAAKYDSGSSSRIIIPADLPPKTVSIIRKTAVKAFKVLDCSGMSRVDFFVHKLTGEVLLNEVNTIPGFTAISMYPKLWEASGIPYKELISRLLDLAMERYEDNRRQFDLNG